MDDTDKNNGMMTKVWGPPGWLFLHSITFGFPHKIDADNIHRVHEYAKFFNSVGNVLPCKYCRESYNEYIKELPIEGFLDSRNSLVTWLYLIHNRVNKKLGVSSECIPPLTEVKDKYEQYRAKCKQTTDKERNENLVKGCIIPKNGVKQKCIINVVNDNDYDFVIYGGLIIVVIIFIILFKGLFYNKP
jgi:hypothetical protein